jgi:hypothetical protein
MDGQCDTHDGSSDPAHCYKSHFYWRYAVHNILQYYFGTGVDEKKPGLIPGDTVAVGSLRSCHPHAPVQPSVGR